MFDYIELYKDGEMVFKTNDIHSVEGLELVLSKLQGKEADSMISYEEDGTYEISRKDAIESIQEQIHFMIEDKKIDGDEMQPF